MRIYKSKSRTTNRELKINFIPRLSRTLYVGDTDGDYCVFLKFEMPPLKKMHREILYFNKKKIEFKFTRNSLCLH